MLFPNFPAEGEAVQIRKHHVQQCQCNGLGVCNMQSLCGTGSLFHQIAFVFQVDLQKLQELDSDFTEMTSQAARDTIVVADRFPFRYLAEDYGLTYYAAFPGCSAETEASFETIVFLSEKMESLHLPCVLVTEGSNSSLAKTILENAGSDGKILTLQSLQAISQKEIDTGVTYLSKMQENYDVLKQALNS